jgi:hypothetical protein
MAESFKPSHEIRNRRESNRSLAKIASRNNFSFQATFAFAKRKPLANSDLSPRPHESFPLKRGVKLLGEKKLAAALKKILHRRILRRQGLRFLAAPVPEQTRRNYTCVVHDQQVVRTQEPGKVSESEIHEFPGVPREVEHACCRPVGQRALCDEFFRQVKIEIRDEHSSIIEGPIP